MQSRLTQTLLPDLWRLVAQYLDSQTAQQLAQVPDTHEALHYGWLLAENLSRLTRPEPYWEPKARELPTYLFMPPDAKESCYYYRLEDNFNLDERDRYLLSMFHPLMLGWNYVLQNTDKATISVSPLQPPFDPEWMSWTTLVDTARDWLAQNPYNLISPVYLARLVDRHYSSDEALLNFSLVHSDMLHRHFQFLCNRVRKRFLRILRVPSAENTEMFRALAAMYSAYDDLGPITLDTKDLAVTSLSEAAVLLAKSPSMYPLYYHTPQIEGIFALVIKTANIMWVGKVLGKMVDFSKAMSMLNTASKASHTSPTSPTLVTETDNKPTVSKKDEDAKNVSADDKEKKQQ